MLRAGAVDRPLPDVAERVRALERFLELQPGDEEIADVAGTCAFFAVPVLRYALPASGSGRPDDAVSCGHAALTATGTLDQNVVDAGFRSQEYGLRSMPVSGDAAGVWEASTETGRERFRTGLGRTAGSSGRGRTPPNPGLIVLRPHMR
ncbi:hypothetical protein OG875_30840 [Streptomyces sp. NBC_01498]|uniref:hypothetical protein n=1 Tax=Streptomyces sp. NBC_01498 TaxID=2975870 RepID=UPI002E7BE6A5|nr:hypothetical protein [Streptomyces sp. NBC_01498]WTL28597.1 hypothetical protein OG875_30840 [Streptomyces sp. NBC_01498]